MADAAARSCESAVDIVAASMPASIIPAIIAGKIPKELINSEIYMITLSVFVKDDERVMF